jgi:hypothetical protein
MSAKAPEEMADELIAELAQRLRFNDLSFDANRVCRLVFDDVHEVDIEQPEGSSEMILHSLVTKVAATGREALYRQCLIGNFFGGDAGNATLCLDPHRDEILLYRRLPLPGTDIIALENAILELVGHLDQVKSSIQAASAQEETQPPLGMDEAWRLRL